MLEALLSDIGATERFRDPIYGYVWLTEDEVGIVDSPVFQRLRRIQQLALTKYVYPTAEHSRFVHSLGVVQCATNILGELLRKKRNRDILLGIIGESELPRFFKVLRFAALLHDIGHLPFSHAGEQAFLPPGIKHEQVSQYIIRNDPTASAVIERNGVEPEVVASLLVGKPTAQYSVGRKIISGVFDADRADYLLRDSYNCGVAYGHYDHIRYVSSFSLAQDEGKDFSLTVEEGSVQALEAFLLARFNYNMQVPYHRTRVGFDCVLEKYLESLKGTRKLPSLRIKTGRKSPTSIADMDLQRFTFLDDLDILQIVKQDFQRGHAWAKMLLRNEHLVPVYDRVERNQEEGINYREYIMMLVDDGLTEGEDFITYSREVRVHDLISGSEERPESAESIKVVDRRGQPLGDFLDHSQVVKTLKDSAIRILRVYVVPRRRAEALRVKDKLAEWITRRAVAGQEGGGRDGP